jgi:protein ImuB
MLWVALHFPQLPPHALVPLAAWACQFTPRVSLEPPQALLLEVGGSLRLFGGQETLLAQLRGGVDALGFGASMATSATARAALWLARGGGGALESLPLEVTGFDQEFFRSIGVATLGQLLALPRAGLAQRCGEGVTRALDEALGAAPEARAFFTPPARFSARLELPAEVTRVEGLVFGAHRLLLQLAGLLAARHEGVRSFVLQLLPARVDLHVGLASPSRDAERLAQLLRERLANVSLQQPVEALELEAENFAPLHGTTRGMFGDAAGDAEDWARLLERLRARLGHDAVYALAAQPDHRPEHAWRRIEPGEWDPREFRAPGPRPVWLLDTPRRLVPGQFELLAGPERIESGWWDGDDARRDYFIARLPDGALAWVYRETDEWRLHGLFA